MTPATLRAAAAIVDAAAAKGHPEWAAIADALTEEAAKGSETPENGPRSDPGHFGALSGHPSRPRGSQGRTMTDTDHTARRDRYAAALASARLDAIVEVADAEQVALRAALDRAGAAIDRARMAQAEAEDAETAMEARAVAAEAQVAALSAAVDRVRHRHPRGDEEPGPLAPGLWCPTCGAQRRDNGYGGCPDRNALVIPGYPLRREATQ